MQAAQQQFLRERNKKKFSLKLPKSQSQSPQSEEWRKKKKKKAISKGIHTLSVIFYWKKNNSGGYWHTFLYKLQI